MAFTSARTYFSRLISAKAQGRAINQGGSYRPMMPHEA